MQAWQRVVVTPLVLQMQNYNYDNRNIVCLLLVTIKKLKNEKKRIASLETFNLKFPVPVITLSFPNLQTATQQLCFALLIDRF